MKYLYRVYFNKKILRHEIAAKMKRQSEMAQETTTTPKRTPSLLRVTYFDDFDLFAPPAAAAATAPTTTTEKKISATSSSAKISSNYRSANDLDKKVVVSSFPRIPATSGPNKSQSLDKTFQRNSEKSGESSLSETAAVPVLPVAIASSPATARVSVTNTPSSSTTTEPFESSCSCEEEFKTPPPRSRDSSTASSGLVSCASKVNEDTLVADVEFFSCDTSAVLGSGRVPSGLDNSCSSIASSSSNTLRSSKERVGDHK